MTNYPYYIPAYFDAGILRKIYRNIKFKSYTEVIEALNKRTKHFPKFMEHYQVMILEYTAEYNGRIVTIYNFGNPISINCPISGIEMNN